MKILKGPFLHTSQWFLFFFAHDEMEFSTLDGDSKENVNRMANEEKSKAEIFFHSQLIQPQLFKYGRHVCIASLKLISSYYLSSEWEKWRQFKDYMSAEDMRFLLRYM